MRCSIDSIYGVTIYITPYHSVDLQLENIERTDELVASFRELLCRNLDTSQYTDDELWEVLVKLTRLYVAKLIYELEHPDLPREYLTEELFETLTKGATIDWKQKAQWEAHVAQQRHKKNES